MCVCPPGMRVQGECAQPRIQRLTPPVDRQTGVKTLPCPTLCLWAVKLVSILHVMAHLHCRTQAWIPVRVQISIPKNGYSNDQIWVRIQCSGGSKGGRPRRPPGPKFSQFHAVFWKICQNHRLAPPPTENPGSAPAMGASVQYNVAIGLGARIRVGIWVRVQQCKKKHNAKCTSI